MKNLLSLLALKSYFQNQKSLYDNIGEIINYTDCDDSPLKLELDSKWFIEDDRLVILDTDEEFEGFDQWYENEYTISSLGSKGKEFFMNTSDNLFFIMAYYENENWDDTSIYILLNTNELKLINI